MATLATRLTSTGNLLVNGTFDEVSMPSGSLFFDGTGDYLTVTNSAALQLTNSTPFTIECWVYPTNLTSPQKYIFENFNSSSPFQGYGLAYNINSTNAVEWWDGGGSWANTGIALTLNEWTHIAVTYEGSGTTRRFFKNGVLSGSAGTVSSSINYTAGECSIGAQEANTPWFGYISNLRIVKGTALYTANFTPSIGILESTANTSLLLNVLNSADYIKDNSSNKFNLTRNGDTAYNSLSPFNRGAHSVSNDTVFTRLSDEVSLAAGSVYFDGTTDYLSIPANAAFDFDSNDFTVEAWVYWISFSYINGSSGRVVQLLSNLSGFSGNGWNIEFGASGASTATSMVFYNRRASTSYSVAGSFTFSTGRWYHLSAVRSGTLLTLYVNGSSIGSGTLTVQTITSTSPMWIGRQDITSYNNDMNGYVSNLRIVKGAALYTANFTPQQTILDSTANTSLLLNVLNSTDFKKDNSPNNFTLTANGNTAWNAFGPFNQGVTGLAERRLSNATLLKDQFDEFTGAPVVDSSLTQWLDMSQRMSYSGSGSSVTDLSGNSNNGTLLNSPSFSDVNGGILIFDGINQYMTIPSTVMPSGTNNFTYSLWINVRALVGNFGSDYGAVLLSGNSVGTLEFYLTSNGTANNDPYSIGFARYGGGTTGSCSSLVTMSRNRWYNIVLIRDGTASNAIYINGVLLVAGNVSNSFSSNTGHIGGAPGYSPYSGHLNGFISQTQIYNRALTNDEVAQNFNALRRRFSI